MTIKELNDAIADLKTYYDFNENAEIKVEVDARSNKDIVRVHVRPADDVDIYMSKTLRTSRSVCYSKVGV